MWKRGEVAQLITRSRRLLRSSYVDIKVAPIRLELDLGQKSEGGLPGKQLVVVVPRAIGSAPVRNRCRRRIRDLYRELLFEQKPWYVIVFVRKSVAEMPFQQLRDFFCLVRKEIEKGRTECPT